MATRGLKLQTPESLLPHTQEERRQVREAKAKEKEDQKAAATSKASKKNATSKARVAKVMDAQAQKDTDMTLIRPDLQLANTKTQK